MGSKGWSAMPAISIIVGLVVSSFTGLTSAQAAGESTMKITPGSGVQVMDVATPGQQVREVFSGSAGQIPTVELISVNLTQKASLHLQSPNGRTTASFPVVDRSFHSLPALSVSGNWSLVLTPAPEDSGTVSLLLTYAVGPSLSLTGSATHRASIPDPTRVRVFTLTPPLGRRPTLTVVEAHWSSTTTSYPCEHTSIYRPDGSLMGDFASTSDGDTDVWNEIQSATTSTVTDTPGNWSLVFRGCTEESGWESFNIDFVADQKHSIKLGTETKMTTKTKGQNVEYAFYGRAGQRLVADIFNLVWDNVHYPNDLLLRRPDGSLLQNLWVYSVPMADPDWFEFEPLDATGVWTFIIDPSEAATGTETLVLNLITDKAPKPLTLDTPNNVSITTAGENRDLSYAGVPGQRLVLHVTSSSWSSLGAGATPGSGNAYATLLDSDGVGVGMVALPASGAATLDVPGTPSKAGTWTLRIDPVNDSVGSVQFSADFVSDVVAPLSFGEPQTLTLSQPYQQAHLHFTLTGSTAMTRLTLTVQGSTFTDATFMALNSMGWTMETAQVTPGDNTLVMRNYFSPGTYDVSSHG